MKKLYLVCNAHLDPCWQWEWEEGAAEALSTFRTAADLCEEFDGLIFNHNEAILYNWIEKYEPELFSRIQQLVREGKWHIMGGWHIQPDCNMPSGESFVRQILLGRNYFKDRFGVEPTTAINFDPFGHTRGLVQILKKAGYDSYLFCRPAQEDCQLPSDDFIWVGYDGSEIIGHRASSGYCTELGKAREAVESWLEKNLDKEICLRLWGMGNHGGGASREDLRDLAALAKEKASEIEMMHSIPEVYFQEMSKQEHTLPVYEKSINPWAVGCYTTMIRIKQKHRLLENELFMAEKMVSSAAIQDLMAYPEEDLHQAMEDLATVEFHDILPGSSIQPVEDAALRLLDHGLEVCSRLRCQAFFALSSGQPKLTEGQVPIVVYNPHPFPVKGIIQCEFQLANRSFEKQFTIPIVNFNGHPVPCQAEKEYSNLTTIDWRKRAVFEAELAPCQVSRFDCTFEVKPERPKPLLNPQNGAIEFTSERLHVAINCATGLVDKLSVDGIEYLGSNAFQPLVMKDNADPWVVFANSFREPAGAFTLMSPKNGTSFSGVVENTLESVRIVEDGDVRTVVEALFSYNNSFLCQTYLLPKQGTELEIEVRVHWNEKDKMLKWSVPTPFKTARILGQQAFGYEEANAQGIESVAQKWVAVISDNDQACVTCINDGVYGFDFADGELRISLLRSPAYCAFPIVDYGADNSSFLLQDRYTPRIDQGERIYRFWLSAGDSKERLEHIDREALIHNEKPFALSFCPSGKGEKPKAGLVLSDDVIQLVAFKKADASSHFVIRLFEPTGQKRETTLSIPSLDIHETITFKPFEVKTFRFSVSEKQLIETDIIERSLS